MISVAPSVWRRLGKFWRERVYQGFHVWNPAAIKADLMRMVAQKLYLRDIQQLLFMRHNAKLQIQTLKRWIMQERGHGMSQAIYWGFF